MLLFQKILIANRGEIAMRIARTCHLMGISTVMVYSDADRDALFVNMAEEAVAIGGNSAAESYLNIDKIIAAAKRTGAEAIHPGYGFLSENADFAARCALENLVFIGPSPESIRLLGSKSSAKTLMQKHGVPVIKGYNGGDQSIQRLLYEAAEIGFPLLIKASAGGGGKGMRIVREAAEIQTALEAVKREALAAFGDETVLLEQYFDAAKHIEVQVMGDMHGKILHFFERECSVQRRFQKIIEEAPSPSINERTRREICAAAVKAVKAANYYNAATVEFLLDMHGEFYFLEVNTRLQVEHPVSEEITGIDLVRMQIEVAQGMKLDIAQEDIERFGHAIEARIYAEDPRNNFRPSTGKIQLWSEARIPEIRYETGVETNSTITTFYDPMIAKIVASGPNRIEATNRLSKALGELCVLGITTNRSFLMELLRNPDFQAAQIDTKYIDRNLAELSILGSTDEETLHEYCVATVLWRSHNRQSETPAYLQNMPRGWRNNFFAAQNETFKVGVEEFVVEYQFKTNTSFSVRVNELTFESVLVKEVGDNHITVVVNGHKTTYDLATENQIDYFVQRVDYPNEHLVLQPRFPEKTITNDPNRYISPMPGEIIKVCVAPNDVVKAGDPLIILSSMKMETTLYANNDGTISEIFVLEKQIVEAGVLLVVFNT